jgi:TolB-like protein
MRKLISLFIVLSSLLISNIVTAYEKEIKTISTTLAEGISKGDKRTVAVVDFTDLQGNITELGRFIAEELSVNLTAMAKGFEVIDRIHLKSILTEHKLSLSGLVNPETVKQLGKIAGVDAIVTGTITPFGDSIRVSVKVITTDTAKIITASTGDIPKTKAIEELIAKGIESPTAPAPTTPATPPAPKPSTTPTNLIARVGGLVFEVTGCKLSGDDVQCQFLVTSKERERGVEICAEGWIFSLCSRSRMFDNLGNGYIAKKILIGNVERIDHVEITLISEVPTKGILTFSGVSQEATSISALEIGGYNKSEGKAFKAQLRNIPLSR